MLIPGQGRELEPTGGRDRAAPLDAEVAVEFDGNRIPDRTGRTTLDRATGVVDDLAGQRFTPLEYENAFVRGPCQGQSSRREVRRIDDQQAARRSRQRERQAPLLVGHAGHATRGLPAGKLR
ncbi:MAG: hypothetical protein K8I65_06320 [Thermoanaerobaculia bacterium]|nr:hypothetical protein [Thermoanaerobaculia bacterium]